jgi:Putative adhesin
MPTYDTPRPITAVVEIAAGAVRLTATDRDDTVVDVRPRDPGRPQDVRAAEQVRIDFADGTLSVQSPRGFAFPRRGAIVVDIGLPSGSRLSASVVSASLTADGEYADCRLASASGDLTVESATGDVKADTASGDISVARAQAASVSTASGDATFGEIRGDVRFRTASGTVTVGRLDGTLSTQSASGDVCVKAAVAGDISVQTASGDFTVGIVAGTAAKLDVRTGSGSVRSALESSDGPAAGDQTLTVCARTGSGDVTVRRAGDTMAA